MTTTKTLGGEFTLPGTELTVKRMGYGAMQLAGPHVWGPPRDREECIQVVRRAIEAGVNHIDTSDFYGPHVTNQILREALHPYPKDLVLVTKVGARRGDKGEWLGAPGRQELMSAVHDNLRNLGLERLDVVNFRIFGMGLAPDVDVEEPMSVMAELQQKGLVWNIGLSNAVPAQLEAAQRIAPIVCVQNEYNVVKRGDDAFIDALGKQGIPYMPFFPLGGFTPLQSGELDAVASLVGATTMQVALAWLLQRSPNVLLIPGTKSVKHLHENLAAAELVLPAEMVARLDALAAA